ncbi:MAG: hypothetical protein DRQ10_05235 [Candidatus Hydrothermota bacterium]|nr:MAG: hypothetical protein DRQ10_05235 [Candidatus Hydrothermae bacterium]
MGKVGIPDRFVQWVYRERAALIRSILKGERIDHNRFYLEFTRHNPAIITYGSAGLNGSIKGVGFIPKPEYLEQVFNEFYEHILKGRRPGYPREGLKLLVKHLYAEDAEQRIDLTKFVSLELAKKHTWTNLHESSKATLLFFQPPSISFEVRCRVEIHEGDLIHKYVNAQHDVYHMPHVERWPDRPAYVFIIEEIFDNSDSEEGFGTKIWP